MENVSFTASFELTMDSFFIPSNGKYPIFFVGMAIYFFSAFCNLILLSLIIVQRNLHKPMYFIFFSLPLNDLIGITAMLPKVMSNILTETNQIYYPACVIQALLLHMYGGATLFILAAMALDRYVAICQPLRYNTIMTARNVVLIILLVWGLDFAFILLLFSLQIRLPRCKSSITNVFCDNPSLLNLTCTNAFLNVVIGLFNNTVMQIISISVQLISYMKILVTCLATRKSESKRKALNTCAAQLTIFLIFEVVGTFTILSHRFNNVSANLQKIMGMLIFIVSPLLNPIVYGFNAKEIRITFFKVVRNKISHFKSGV